MLDQLRQINTDRLDIDEAVALLSFGRGVRATYVEHDMTPPDWLTENVSVLEREVKARRRDNLERALKAAQARKDSLRTAEEKRATVDAEIERLTAALGNG